MAATDSKGKSVSYGDYLIVEAAPMDKSGILSYSGVVRVAKLSQSPQGVAAVGAFVDLVGHGRVAKLPIDVSKSTLVAKSNGEVVS